MNLCHCFLVTLCDEIQITFGRRAPQRLIHQQLRQPWAFLLRKHPTSSLPTSVPKRRSVVTLLSRCRRWRPESGSSPGKYDTSESARRLKTFFAEKNPALLNEVDSMLACHVGREDEMFMSSKKVQLTGKESTDIGVVEAIIAWNGVPGAGRRVRWDHGPGATEDVRWGYGGDF